MTADSSLPPSSRVRLEVAFLDADQGAPETDAPAPLGTGPRLTVIVVAAEADVRRYVRECLRERDDLRLREAGSVAAAVALASDHAPDLLLVDEPECAVLAALADVPAVVIGDDVPQGARPTGERVRLLARPFTAAELMAEVGAVLP